MMHSDINKKTQQINNAYCRQQPFNMRSFSFRTKKIKLAARETQVLAGTILGMTAKQMGEVLFLSPRTVEYYLKNIKAKFAGMCRYKIISYALANNFPVHNFLQAFRINAERGILHQAWRKSHENHEKNST